MCCVTCMLLLLCLALFFVFPGTQRTWTGSSRPAVKDATFVAEDDSRYVKHFSLNLSHSLHLCRLQSPVTFYYCGPMNILPCGVFPNFYPAKTLCAEVFARDPYTEGILNRTKPLICVGWVGRGC